MLPDSWATVSLQHTRPTSDTLIVPGANQRGPAGLRGGARLGCAVALGLGWGLGLPPPRDRAARIGGLGQQCVGRGPVARRQTLRCWMLCCYVWAVNVGLVCV